jgi:hypothetical protein
VTATVKELLNSAFTGTAKIYRTNEVFKVAMTSITFIDSCDESKADRYTFDQCKSETLHFISHEKLLKKSAAVPVPV